MFSTLYRLAREAPESDLNSIRAALDDANFGIVILDTEMRATYINPAFRKMWQLPDEKAEANPAFVALMYHGRDTGAYDVPTNSIDVYVAERVAHVKSGDTLPRDLRLRDGRVLRFQCVPLPNGGRMLSYTYVTDIVRHLDDLEVLRVALDNIEDGVMILDAQLRVHFMNQAARSMWKFDLARVGSNPTFIELAKEARWTGAHAVSDQELDHYIAARIAIVRAGDPRPYELRTSDGRVMRAKCSVLPDGGRMLTYTDVTNLVAPGEAPDIAPR
jgi:PAS domain-containing protein